LFSSIVAAVTWKQADWVKIKVVEIMSGSVGDRLVGDCLVDVCTGAIPSFRKALLSVVVVAFATCSVEAFI